MQNQNSRSCSRYFLIINIEEVLAFNNLEQAEVITILESNFVKNLAHSEEKAIVLETLYPFFIGFFRGKTKPDLNNFLKQFFDELRRLSPTNDNVNETMGREFAASLHCVLADTPMRTYLKKYQIPQRVLEL